MTAKPKPRYTCEVCRIESPGWHTVESDDAAIPPKIVRCPQYLATVQQQHAQELVADAHTEAFKAAKQIIRDAAQRLPVFSANEIRRELDDARIPGPVVGSAFRALAQCNDPIIERTNDRVQSNEDTTRHEIYRWRSLVFGQRRGVA